MRIVFVKSSDQACTVTVQKQGLDGRWYETSECIPEHMVGCELPEGWHWCSVHHEDGSVSYTPMPDADTPFANRN